MDCITGWLKALIMDHQHQPVLYLRLPDECFQPANDTVRQPVSPYGISSLS